MIGQARRCAEGLYEGYCLMFDNMHNGPSDTYSFEALPAASGPGIALCLIICIDFSPFGSASPKPSLSLVVPMLFSMGCRLQSRSAGKFQRHRVPSVPVGNICQNRRNLQPSISHVPRLSIVDACLVLGTEC